MAQKRKADFLPKKDIEDYRALRHSNFWKYLPNKTRHHILWILGDDPKMHMQEEFDF